jgi:hypothetical protein
MVAESRDAPYFWISADYVAWWRSHPELGLPTANPLASLTQDFQHGHAEVTATSSGLSAEPRITLVDDPAAELPAPAARRRHILRQPDGTAWRHYRWHHTLRVHRATERGIPVDFPVCSPLARRPPRRNDDGPSSRAGR